MRSIIIGVLLTIIGISMLAYGHFSYKTEEQVLEIGPVKATAERTKTVPLPPVVGWACVGGGIFLLVVGGLRSKR